MEEYYSPCFGYNHTFIHTRDTHSRGANIDNTSTRYPCTVCRSQRFLASLSGVPVLRKTKEYLLNTQLLEPHTNQQELDHITDVWPFIIVRYYQYRGVVLRYDSVYMRAHGVRRRDTLNSRRLIPNESCKLVSRMVSISSIIMAVDG
jgi:hypothetical protein